MHRPIVAVLLAMGVFLMQPTPAAARQNKPGEKPRYVGGCIKFAQEELPEGGLRLELRNVCPQGLACVVSWQVTCGGLKAEPRSSLVELGPKATEYVLASARSCGGAGWPGLADAVDLRAKEAPRR